MTASAVLDDLNERYGRTLAMAVAQACVLEVQSEKSRGRARQTQRGIVASAGTQNQLT